MNRPINGSNEAIARGGGPDAARNPAWRSKAGLFRLIQEVSGGVRNKRVWVIGSGDNMAAFALAGLGARVTSGIAATTPAISTEPWLTS